MNSIERAFVLAIQTESKVYEVAEKITQEKKAQCYRVESFRKEYSQEYEEVMALTVKLGWSEYLFENTLSALLALKKVNLTYDIDDLEKVKLFGRFYKILPNVTIDVGHNLLAAKAIVEALKKEKQKPILVYNALSDKDYVNILKLFKPHVQSVEIIEIETSRAVERKILEESLNLLDIHYTLFDAIDNSKEYLVFGSFYVVEKFLKMQR